jgi:hypothetical protein
MKEKIVSETGATQREEQTEQGPADGLRFEGPVREFVAEHLELKDEPLLFALYYKPKPDEAEEDVYLLEIADNFGSNEIDPDRELFEAGMAPPSEYGMQMGGVLRLTLTNPVEFETAVREGWGAVDALKQVVRRGSYKVIYPPDGDGRFLDLLRG